MAQADGGVRRAAMLPVAALTGGLASFLWLEPVLLPLTLACYVGIVGLADSRDRDRVAVLLGLGSAVLPVGFVVPRAVSAGNGLLVAWSLAPAIVLTAIGGLRLGRHAGAGLAGAGLAIVILSGLTAAGLTWAVVRHPCPSGVAPQGCGPSITGLALLLGGSALSAVVGVAMMHRHGRSRPPKPDGLEPLP